MPQQWPAADIARMVLDGFDDYREHFRQITDGARARFEQAQWQATQVASAARINLYEEKVSETVERLRIAGKATLPVSLGQEKHTNPFLRADNPDLMAELGTTDPVATFALLREKRNGY